MRTLQDWYETPLGQLVAQLERELLDRHLDRWAGAHLLQVGGFGYGQRVLRANTSRQWLVDLPGHGPVDCRLEPEHLPFQSDTMDMVVLVHSLEFGSNPHRVLREAERVLSPEGHLLVLSFNLFSLWGLAHAIPALRRRGAPWCGEYFSSRRVRDWLHGAMTGLGLLFWAGIAWAAIRETLRRQAQNELSPILNVPVAPFRWLMVSAFVLLCAILAFQAVRLFLGRDAGAGSSETGAPR